MKKYYILSLIIFLGVSQTCLAGGNKEEDDLGEKHTPLKPKKQNDPNNNNLNAPPASISPIQEVIQGKVYTLQVSTRSGEKIYFGIEKADEKSTQFWKSFGSLIYMHTKEDKGIFLGLAKYSKPDTKKPESLEYNKLASLLGMSNSEFEDYMKEFANKKMYEKKQLKKLKAINVEAMTNMPEDDLSYVAYASKKPINGYFWQTIRESVRNEFFVNNIFNLPKISVKDYRDNFRDLLIKGSILIRKGSPKYFASRSIFTNPETMINDDHEELEMRLLSFCGVFAAQYFDSQYMVTYPAPSLKKVMESQDSKHPGFYMGTKKEAHPAAPQEMREHMEKETHKLSCGFLDSQCLVTVKYLEEYFKREWK